MRVILLAMVFSLPGLWPQQARASVCAELYPQVWQMEISEDDVGKPPERLLAKPAFVQAGKLRNLDDRLSVGKAPDGSPALQMNVHQGENKIISFHSRAVGKLGLSKACLSAKIYYSGDFDVKRASTKIGLGLWGGDGSEGRKDSGGWPPELQSGWSVRVLNNRRGLRIYAYHLERQGKRKHQKRCEPYGCLWGDVIDPATKFAKDRWVPLDLEVVLNDIGEHNGRVRLWVDGVLAAEKDGLVFRRQPHWNVQGMKFTDMWGGDTSARKNFSPKPQAHWYKDYVLYGEP